MAGKRAAPKIFWRAKELRQHMTHTERALWARVRNHQLGPEGFRRQYAIGQFILDFCCPRRKLVIELDGPSHANQLEYDAARTAWLAEQGWRVARFSNQEIERDIDGVVQKIQALLKD